MNPLRAAAAAGIGLLLAIVAPSCGGSTSPAGTDSNTHWLDQCSKDADCGGLSCRCGVCTTACQASTDCARFSADAVCQTTCASESPSCVRPADAGSGSGCPSHIDPGTPCDEPGLVCKTPCLQGYSMNYTCGEGNQWVAGHGLFPCGPDGGTRTDAGTGHPDAAPSDAGPPDCAPLDATNGVAQCAAVTGYGWDGLDCIPLLCGCTGKDCDRTYPTLDACLKARTACFAARNVHFECTTSADCGLVTRTCCGPCAPLVPDDLRALTLDSIGAWNGISCALPVACPPSCTNPLGGLQSACVEGRCVVKDFSAYQNCGDAGACHLAAKDCCACGSLLSNALVALSDEAAYRAAAGCSCPACPQPVTSISLDSVGCDTQAGLCQHIPGE